MFVVDTNVLVYAADRDSPDHSPCRAWLGRWRAQRGAWYTTWGIIYEFLRISTHPRVLRNPWVAARAWSFVQALVDSPGFALLIPTERHTAIATQVFSELPHVAGNL